MKTVRATVTRMIEQSVEVTIEVADDASKASIHDDLCEAAWCSDAWRKTSTQQMEVEDIEEVYK